MNRPRIPPRPPGDAGGAWRPAWGLGAAALAVLGGGAWLLLARDPGDAPPPPATATAPAAARAAEAPPALPAPAAAPASAAGPVPAADRPAVPARAPAAPQPAAAAAPVAASDDLAAHVPPGTVPSMKEVIGRLQQAGVRTGIGAFNPPGTRPPLVGLAVPEDFELPAGYLRHHQATDDGQRIEAILMFDPDHPPAAAAGRSLATPADRVVPPELAPRGLPIRTITLPAPAETEGPRR